MKLSVIIPAWNEERVILRTLRSLQSERTTFPVERIVVDGGSDDATVQLAQSTGAKVIVAERGRAKQMNAGAAEATGDALLFLHSDCVLEKGALELLGRTIARKKIDAGCFRLAFTNANASLKLIARGSDLRARWLKIMFGDQGIFATRELFQRAGGFPDIELMEDLEFSRRIKKIGNIGVINKKIYTSPRRFETGGTWKTVWLMQKLKWMYWRGVPPSELRKYYEDHR